jgi:hypothetical protein
VHLEYYEDLMCGRQVVGWTGGGGIEAWICAAAAKLAVVR